MRHIRALSGLVFSATLLLSLPASAQTAFTGLPLPPAATIAVPFSMNADGSMVAGSADGLVPGNYILGQPLYWQDGNVVLLPLLPGYLAGAATGISADGSVISGFMADGPTIVPVLWVNGVPQFLSNMNADQFLMAGMISGDGNVVIGKAMNVMGNAYTWTNGVQALLSLPGGYAAANPLDLNYDGSVIVGSADDTVGSQTLPVTWTGGVMSTLALLPGMTAGQALGVSNDGTMITGYQYVGGGIATPVLWTGGTPSSLMLLAGHASGQATNISGDGMVVIGNNYDGVQDHAVRWIGGSVESLQQVLIDEGVNMANWTLNSASAINDDGTVIAGYGTLNGVANQAFLMAPAALTTPAELAEAVQPLGTGMNQAQVIATSVAGQSIFAARQAFIGYTPSSSVGLDDIAPSAGGADALLSRHKWSAYAVGNIGIGQNNDFSSHNVNGTTGLIYRASDSVAIGAGVIGGRSNTDLRLGGDSRIDVSGAAVIAAYEPDDSGLRLYGVVHAAYLDIAQDRHYLNGGGIDGSAGDTHGMGYGAALQAGWSYAHASGLRFRPYAQVDMSHTRIDGYAETGGAMAAVVGDQRDDLVNTRLGLEVSRAVTPVMELRGRGAWGHRLAGEDASLNATVIGITQAVPFNNGDRDWLEGGVTAVYRLSQKTTLAADLSARAGETSDPAVQMTVGLNIGF